MKALSAIPIKHPAFRGVLLLLVFGPIISAIAAVAVGEATAERYFAEGGPVEEMSMLLWLVLGLFCVGTHGFRTFSGWSGLVLCLAASAREADWHLRFTDYSVLKIPFYYRPEHPIEAKLIAGAAVLLIGVAITIVLVRIWRRARNSGGAVPVWGWLAIAGVGALFVSKVLDRSTNVLEESFGIILPDLVRTSVWVMEETSETTLPIAFGAAILSFVMSGDRDADGTPAQAEGSR